MAKRKNHSKDALANCYLNVARTAKKLMSLGLILEQQSFERDGATELDGIGMLLSDLGESLQSVGSELDEITLKLGPMDG